MTTYPDAQSLAEAGLRIEVAGEVVTVSLARPEVRNAQTPATWRALAAIGAALTADIRVVVVRADGAAFSAGLDRAMFAPDGVAGESSLVELAGLADAELDETLAGFQAGFSWLRRPDVVSVAAVQGHAIGAGFQLALACDVRVVADDVQFAMRETSLGIVPDLGGTKPLVDAVGYSRALEICATGRFVQAAEARDLGIATVVVPTQRLAESVSDLVAALTAPLHGAVAATKQLLLDAADRSYDEQRQAERTVQASRLRDVAAAFTR
ncbi:MAG: enoyl-CoA hydratase/isomerase family protein [Nocardioidaceae bacterium]|nr:enoyl-CoA hydratase/isomerase family protein [Nocardioidaceae bacterium]